MNAVSLFAGVGGFDLALERNGVKVVASVEIDKHASKVLARHFPNSKLFNDVKEVTGEQLIECGFDPTNGIVVGGFPCQDVSVAGRRAGLTRADGTHTRSGLFWEVVRILEETKAHTFILENVPGLLSSNGGRDFGTVIGALDELGYGVSWRILDAQYFGVPQRRRRVFIVGCLGDPERSSEILALSEGRAGYLAKGEQKGKATAGNVADSAGIFGQSSFGGYAPGVKTLSHSMYKRPGDSVVIPFSPSSFAQYSENSDISATIRAGGGDLGGGSETLLTFHMTQDPISGSVSLALKATQGAPSVVMPTLSASNNPSRSPQSAEVTEQVAVMVEATSIVRRLTPTECEALQGFPRNWTADQSDVHRYKQMGNAVAVPVVEWIIKRVMEYEDFNG